ncbi:MAG: 30S ribosomal protein S20 [Candidatus Saganbacteria bacterium]|nr:30S ribosomal protein S20 [Candidatus Saganbacteria bacterium]
MANIKSAKKRIMVTKRNRQRNLFYKNKVKKLIKEAKQAIEQGTENASELVRLAIKWLDKAALKNVIKKNTASRRKSRIMKAVNKKKK